MAYSSSSSILEAENLPRHSFKYQSLLETGRIPTRDRGLTVVIKRTDIRTLGLVQLGLEQQGMGQQGAVIKTGEI